MAKSEVPAKNAPTDPPAAPAAEREIPSFSQVAEEQRDARTTELRGLAGLSKDGATPPAEKPAGDAMPYDGRKAWDELPEDLRTWAARQLYDTYNTAIGQQYGDLLPLLVEANQNPNLRATLAAAATDPELREYLADPEARAEIKRMTNKELRKFLFTDAAKTFEQYAVAPTEAERADPVAELRSEFETERNTGATKDFVTASAAEAQALAAAFPQFDESAVRHVVATTLERFENAALRQGIKTRDAQGKQLPSWPGEAIRKGIKPPQFREYGAQYAEIVGRTTPPAAPAGSRAEIPDGPPQAPRDRTEAEARKRGIDAIRKIKTEHPGFKARGR